MTIKQQGGIFGRNPTFNDVEIDGTLTVNGPTSQAAVNGTTGYFSSTLGVATDAPDARLSVLGTGLTSTGNSNTLNAGFGLDGTGAPQPLMAMRWVGTDHAGIGGTNFVSQIVVDSANSIATEIYNTGASPLIFGTNSTERMRINGTGNLSFPSGQGIDFSATSGTGTSELFDDYEEGTWSPVISDATSGGNIGSSTVAYATYTKIGNVVYLKARLFNMNTTSMGTGNMYIQGLPFTASGDNDGILTTSFFTAAANSLGVFPSVDNGASYLKLKEVISGGVYINADTAQFASGTADLWITITYHAG